MSLISTSTNRLIPLEASRGIAATIVLAHHFLLAFFPVVEPRIIGRWYYVFVNGTGAVHFFFVLSGFVLCWAYFRTGEISRLKEGFIKRWPRLAAPVLITTITSFSLFYFNFYYFENAGKLSQSVWLSTFGGALKPDFHPSLFEAIKQGLTTFITGDPNYNINLWTMKPEFMGSMVVFTTAAFISIVLSYQFLLISFFLFSFWALGIYSDIFPFIAGIFLSAHLARREIKISTYYAVFMLLLGIFLLGYAIPEKNYFWFRYLNYFDIAPGKIEIVTHSIGSSLIIFAIMTNSRIYRGLNNRLCNYLGVFSFPLYLVHTLVICSFSSFVYIFFKQSIDSHGLAALLFFGLTLIASIAASMPLVLFDKFWVNRVNQFVRQIFHV